MVEHVSSHTVSHGSLTCNPDKEKRCPVQAWRGLGFSVPSHVPGDEPEVHSQPWDPVELGLPPTRLVQPLLCPKLPALKCSVG